MGDSPHWIVNCAACTSSMFGIHGVEWGIAFVYLTAVPLTACPLPPCDFCDILAACCPPAPSLSSKYLLTLLSVLPTKRECMDQGCCQMCFGPLRQATERDGARRGS